MEINFTDAVECVYDACRLAGYSPVGEDEFCRIKDACSYVKNTAPPPGEENLWMFAMNVINLALAPWITRCNAYLGC
jgi:hypothetical protein